MKNKKIILKIISKDKPNLFYNRLSMKLNIKPIEISVKGIDRIKPKGN